MIPIVFAAAIATSKPSETPEVAAAQAQIQQLQAQLRQFQKIVQEVGAERDTCVIAHGSSQVQIEDLTAALQAQTDKKAPK